MVAVFVADHHRIGPLAQRAQQRHHHALAGIAVHAVARTGVEQQAVAGGANQQRAALPDVDRHHLEHARRRPLRAPQQTGRQQKRPATRHTADSAPDQCRPSRRKPRPINAIAS